MLSNIILSLIDTLSLVNLRARGYLLASSITFRALVPSGRHLLVSAVPLIEVSE